MRSGSPDMQVRGDIHTVSNYTDNSSIRVDCTEECRSSYKCAQANRHYKPSPHVYVSQGKLWKTEVQRLKI